MTSSQSNPKAEHEELIALINKALRDDGWLGHTDEIEEWHINAIANTIARHLVQLNYRRSS